MRITQELLEFGHLHLCAESSKSRYPNNETAHFGTYGLAGDGRGAAELAPNSLVTWSVLREVLGVVGLSPGSVLVDLACGAGGLGRALTMLREEAREVLPELDEFDRVVVAARRP